MMSSSKQKGKGSGLAKQDSKKKVTEPSAKGTCKSPHAATYKPLKGKSFYLDVRRQAAKLKKDLEDLGAVVETFLSKDVSYVVSDRPEVRLECSKNAVSLHSAASPAVSTPSPFNQSKDSGNGAADSGGREGMVTRGKAIVQKATISQTYGTSNVLANARNWDVTIHFIDTVLKYINKEKQKMRDAGVSLPQTQNQGKKDTANPSKERKLSKPSLKVEDASGHYRPSTKEMTSWPRVTFDGYASSCPFDVLVPGDKADKRTVNTHEQGAQARADQQRRQKDRVDTPRVAARKQIQVPTPGRQRDVGVKDTRKGYCECCLTKYADLEKHLAGEQHRSFVRENNHYVNLDLMIDEGPNMDQFLEDVVQHHEWQKLEGIRGTEVIDEVALISSPGNAKKRKTCPVPASKFNQQEAESQDTDPCRSGIKTSSNDNTQERPAKDNVSPQHLESTYSVDQSASCGVSPLRRSLRLQAPAVESSPTAVSNPNNERVTSVPGAVSNKHVTADNQPSGVQGENIVRESASNDKRLRDKLHSGNSGSSQSPPLRHSRRPRSQSQGTLSSTPTSNPQVTLAEPYHSPCELIDKSLTRGVPDLSDSPEPERTRKRRTSKLSLSARRQSQKQANTPTEVVSADKESCEQPANQSRVQESDQVFAHTPSGTGKRERSLRLSLTARKRLLKRKELEYSQQASDIHSKAHEGTFTGEKDSNLRQSQRTSADPKHRLEADANTHGIDALTSSSKNPQQHGSQQTSTSVPRSSKRKRESNDKYASKNPKRRITDTQYQTHVSHKEREKLAGKISQQSRTIEKNVPTNVEGSPGQRTSQDVFKENKKQVPNQIGCELSTRQPNLESIFNSDPTVVESSFLGFASDDITETEQRLQQLSALSTSYTSKLQEAALNVCCIPSSELNIPEDDDSGSNSSDMSEIQEVVVGMALRNLANFPSDGSDWEAKVGGFMSVRLDEAMQVKQKESFLTQVCMQEKENMKGNNYQEILHNSGKGAEQANMTKQTTIKIKSVTPTDKSGPKEPEIRLASADARAPQPRRVLNYESNHAGRSKRKKSNLENQASKPRSSLALVSTNPGLSSSPVKSPKLVCSTPKKTKKTPSPNKYKLVFSPETPKEEREIILEHYVHDVSEEEIDFPKFSSPRQSNVILSPIKNFAKSISKKSCSQSPYKLKASRGLRELPPRRSLFRRRRHSTSSMPGRVFHFLLSPPGSPRKRDPPVPSSPLKLSSANPSHSFVTQLGDSSHQITYLPANEHHKVSPIFCTSSKPNFSSHILHPGNKKRRSDRLRRPSSSQPVAGNCTLDHPPAKSWSLCVAFDDDICCSEDVRVYDFVDDKEGKAETSTDRSSQTHKVTCHNKKSPTKSKSNCTTNQKTQNPSEQVVQEFGLPYSFFR
ncbi:protein chiffon-like [Patiria miniata]|uniref:DBF4-type domain-containing protein n=1 Tax=Patiria miniata TaxID=46514 RepID=A0A913Z0K7_PATMI|nr:protein chiffon-like [Patiria miniata]